MSETTVGQIVGYLRMDHSEWDRDIDKADAKADQLGRKDPKISIKTNAPEAIAQLDAVEKASNKVDSSSRQAGRGMGILAASIATLGPALVPLAVGAAGLAVGWSAMGAAGVAAIIGIRHEMQTGTAVGVTYSGQMKILTTDMYSLGRVAATGVLGPFEATVRRLQQLMPNLTGNVRDFSVITGKTAANITTGLLAAFVALEPLMQDIGVYTLDLSRRFEHLMTGSGVTSFGDYVRSVFPQVMATVESLVGATIHLVAAFAPLGGGVLTEVKLLSDLINALPVSVLATLATVASAAFLGFKSYGLITGLVEGLSGGLVKLGISAESAAGGLAILEGMAGPIAIAVAAATFLFVQHSEAVRANQQAIDDYTQALRASNGALTENVRATAFKKLEDDGAIDAANRLGISLGLVTDAALGNSAAAREVAKEMAGAASAQNDYEHGGQATGRTAGETNDAINKLSDGLGVNSQQFQAAKKNQADWEAASKTSTDTTSAQAVAQQALATGLGTTTTALQAAMTAQQQQKDSAAVATAQMQLENDAAGLLKQALDALSGKSMSAAQAQNAFDQQLITMDKHADKLGTTLYQVDKATGNLDEASTKNRATLIQGVTAAEQAAEAYGNMKKSTEAGRQKLEELRTTLIRAAVQSGMSKAEVTKFVDSILSIPKKAPATQFDADTKAALAKVAGLQTAINRLTGKTVMIYAQELISQTANSGSAQTGYKRNTGVAAAMNAANQFALGNVYSGKPPARAGGGDVPGYAGGTLIGPGSGMSDSILAMVAQTQQLVRLSTGEFVSTSASRSRNRAALEAGNRGAKLEVAGKGGMHVEQHFYGAGQSPQEIAEIAVQRLAFQAASQ